MITLNTVYAQIGINTKRPQTIFHIDGQGDDPIDGSIPSQTLQLDDFVITSLGQVGIGTIALSNFSAVEIASKKNLLLPR